MGGVGNGVRLWEWGGAVGMGWGCGNGGGCSSGVQAVRR